MRLALVLVSVVVAAQSAAAGPFGPGRSEGAPPTKKKAKPAKKTKPAKAIDDKADPALVVIEEAPRAAKRTAVAKSEPKVAKKLPKPVDDEDVVLVDDEDEPVSKKPAIARAKAPQATDDEEVSTKSKAKSGKAVAKRVKADPIDDEVIADSKARPGKKPALAKKETRNDEITITIDDEPAKPAIAKKAKAAPSDELTLTIDDDNAIAKSEGLDDDELESDDAEAKTTALLDEDGEPLDDITPSVAKASAPRSRHKTRFYFRLGMLKQSSKLGATEFSLQTDLQIDTSSLGNGDSGVEMQQANFPVAMIVGYVLPVLNRKMSLETIIGLPTKTRFKATGSLANESLAPTFMGVPTGIEPLGENIGEATFAPPMLTAVYRIAELGPVTPFAGTGIMLLMARGAKITNPVLNEAGDPKLSFSPSPGLVLQGGAEMRIWKRISARLDVKYVLGMKVNAKIENIAVTPKAIPTIPSIEVGDAVMSAKITPLVIQLGVGADF